MTALRLRTFTLWTGTLLSLLIAAAFVVSAWWFVTAQAGKVCVYFVSGGIVVGLDFSKTPLVERHPFGLFRWTYWGAGPRFVELPLYTVFAAVAIPTLLVWRFGPTAPKPGHCGCGYDLTGNTSGLCPECGVEVRA